MTKVKVVNNEDKVASYEPRPIMGHETDGPTGRCFEIAKDCNGE